MSKMRAVVQNEFGGPEVLTLIHDAPIPEPSPTEVQVHVSHVGVNPVDGKTRGGASVAKLMGAFPITVGWDIAGEVSALGNGVNRFAVGDRVFGMPRFPYPADGYAEFVTSPSRHLVRIPDSLDFATAASIPLPATTAYQIVHEAADVRSGQSVLVLGGGGTVGTYVVQMAKKLGATVIGHATGEKLRHLESLGVDRAIDYASEEFDDPNLSAGGISDVDIVIDLIGGEFALRAVPLTKPDGVVVGVPSGQQQGLDAAAAQAGVRWTNVIVEPDHVALEYVAELIENGELHVPAPATAPLEDVVAVHRQMDDGHLPKTALAI
ncbi:NADP-dependent oxidoreductase [Brevibacterium aurantiacum]|uniref:NADP-dependent oxidoreductase n=1 Tax=Brevibacterium aurantiacum TaxID=273384 RepID=A0A556C8X5_BREAU|nr:NADP-dependent oxidoreductase [Brevibacterium aurantiacum]TSI13905.1 NADP-dependent oxidoreductase [Brevibacterium aurantiacum]